MKTEINNFTIMTTYETDGCEVGCDVKDFIQSTNTSLKGIIYEVEHNLKSIREKLPYVLEKYKTGVLIRRVDINNKNVYNLYVTEVRV